MAQIDHKHPTMTLYVARQSPITHWIGIVLAEKMIIPNIVFVDPEAMPTDLARINPHGVLPFLAEREGLMLYAPHVMVEYLDERFPHPPLLPVYPITRAKYRQLVYQIAKDWYGLLHQIESKGDSEAEKLLQQGLLKIAPLLEAKPYFLSDEFTLVDCCIAPILARLSKLGLRLFEKHSALDNYQSRLFAREAFQHSLRQMEIE